MCINVYMSAVSHYGSSFCVFIFSLQLVLPLLAAVCERGHQCVGMHVHLRCFLSRCRIATYWVSQSLRMFWSPLTHMSVPQTLSSGSGNFCSLRCLLWLRHWSDFGMKMTSLTCVVRVHYCAPLWKMMFGFPLYTRRGQQIVFKGKLLILKRVKKQADSLGEGMLCVPATPCSVYIVCVFLMNYGWGYRSLSSALLHWPT